MMSVQTVNSWFNRNRQAVKRFGAGAMAAMIGMVGGYGLGLSHGVERGKDHLLDDLSHTSEIIQEMGDPAADRFMTCIDARAADAKPE